MGELPMIRHYVRQWTSVYSPMCVCMRELILNIFNDDTDYRYCSVALKQDCRNRQNHVKLDIQISRFHKHNVSLPRDLCRWQIIFTGPECFWVRPSEIQRLHAVGRNTNENHQRETNCYTMVGAALIQAHMCKHARTHTLSFFIGVY